MIATLTVFQTVAPDDRRAPAGAALRAHVLTVECDADLVWLRAHADEIACAHIGPDYVALNVQPVDLLEHAE